MNAIRESQVNMLAVWLKQRGSITPIEALNELGIYRLGARIHELRRQGHQITTNLEPVINKLGHVTRPAVYVYHGREMFSPDP